MLSMWRRMSRTGSAHQLMNVNTSHPNAESPDIHYFEENSELNKTFLKEGPVENF
jgi:hypothetical protein